MSQAESTARIVLIDDNRDDRELIARTLRQTLPQLELIEVNDRSSFEQALALDGFNVVVTDYALRWTTGLDVLDIVSARHPDVPVIMFTNTGNEEIASEGMKRGLFDYVVKKSGSFQRLAAAARAALGGAELKGRVAALVARERTAREEAERANRLKDEFLATLSHELRTPLNAILGWSHVLQIKAVQGEELKKGMQVIERNARAQAKLIEDLLDLSRIVAGTLRLEIETVDLRRLVEAAVASVRPMADAKRITIEPQLAAPAMPLRADPARLQQIVSNLLTNAVKFSPEGSAVWVITEHAEGAVQITVADHGQGIASEFLPHIFNRFSQSSTGTTRSHGGLGIGLAIVKHLAEAHGGAVSAQSGGVGQGSKFTVRLPVLEERDAQDATKRRTPFDFKSLPSLNGVTVVAVDDDADSLEVLRRMLVDSNAIVHTAGSAAAGLELVRTQNPTVLLSDIGMPNGDGYAFIGQVRKLPAEQGGNVPAIAVTAFARSEDRERALDAGYQEHVAKPINPTELIGLVAGLAARSLGSL